MVFLRALQEGECSFPYVLRDTPTAQAMMNYLALAYPEVKKGFTNEPFASIYDATITYGRNQISQNGSVSIYRLIEEMRRAIVQSANANVATAPSISSQPPSMTPAVPQNKVPQTKSTGSGFFVTQAGHLLTNAHVVSDCTIISVKSSGGQAGVAQVIAVDQNDDLALLKLDRRTETTAAFRIGRPLRAGESAVVFGFPLSQLLASTGNVTTGVVTALAGPLDDPHQIQISAPVQPGNSGGPVLDASGYLIGVVVSKLNPVFGDVPQNVNFAIKASTAANFLDAHGIAYKSAAGEKELPIPDIVAQARDFSVQVLCQDSGPASWPSAKAQDLTMLEDRFGLPVFQTGPNDKALWWTLRILTKHKQIGEAIFARPEECKKYSHLARNPETKHIWCAANVPPYCEELSKEIDGIDEITSAEAKRIGRSIVTKMSPPKGFECLGVEDMNDVLTWQPEHGGKPRKQKR